MALPCEIPPCFDPCESVAQNQTDNPSVEENDRLWISKNEQEYEENGGRDGCSTWYGDSHFLDAGGSPGAPALCARPICRQFWKAGNYETGSEVPRLKASSNKDGRNHLLVHPMFLHSNATSHKWVFGAIAELTDNAVDEARIQNGATYVAIDKISNPRDGSPALLIQDDGGGMDPGAIRHCMSFGFSDKKMKQAIGQYGNGFKTSSMRLGADVIVFSRHINMRTMTQSIGLLSFTFLRQLSSERVVVPTVDYEFNALNGSLERLFEHGSECFFSNLSLLLKWSPYRTEEELLKQFDDIGYHGTKVVIYNLWLTDDGDLELDFNSDPEDVRINGDLKLFEAGDYRKIPAFDGHIAYRYQYSLHAYLSILYLRLPQSFNIKLRGRVVEHHNIANDLQYPEFILYKPQIGDEAAVVTTIGFLKEAPILSIHGFSIYHRNRLILPFWKAMRNRTSSVGRGVVGVLEVNYIEPTHNKQDFVKTSAFQRLEDRLKKMSLEYWHLHAGKALESLKDPVVPKRKRSSADVYITRYQQGQSMMTKEQNHPGDIEFPDRYTDMASKSLMTDTWFPGEVQQSIIENQVGDQAVMDLLLENERLQLLLLEIETRENELKIKVQQLLTELKDIQHEYTKLLEESLF
ncbi:hypothetical protein SLEP1_g45310 [Rubroshorea leprosula]|uniref:Morc S5 domain-containing protein n=1 Tax=Rubroshorea leprosula TaxID=152421 RepID=A0AAV5LJF2_9ROSI|nr:hypothetical protein SLEP1_g45310 [Rubroshorea leprosula]